MDHRLRTPGIECKISSPVTALDGHGTRRPRLKQYWPIRRFCSKFRNYRFRVGVLRFCTDLYRRREHTGRLVPQYVRKKHSAAVIIIFPTANRCLAVDALWNVRVRSRVRVDRKSFGILTRTWILVIRRAILFLHFTEAVVLNKPFFQTTDPFRFII